MIKLKKVVQSAICLIISMNLCTYPVKAEKKDYDQHYKIIYQRIFPRVENYELASWLTENIIYYSSYYSIDPLLTTALLEQESNFNLHAISEAGAVGVAQIMPSTADGIGIDVYDPTQNLIGGIYYFALQMAKFSQSGEWQTTYALAAYNAGAGVVEQYGGVPPYPETIAYINSIAEKYNQLRSSYKQI